MTKSLLLACLFPLCAPLLADGATCSVKGGERTPAVVELFTSEGCDSCPPADKWLSTLKADASLIPLAFHVDYWDYLGWRDEFAKAAYSERQRAGVRRQGGKVSYTPQVVVDGQDLRGWFRAGAFDAGVAKAQSRPARAQLELSARREGAGVSLDVKGLAAGSGGSAAGTPGLFLAVTEKNLTSKVAAGENKGATLHHDHVVRELFGPFAPDAAGQFAVARSIVPGERWKRADLTAIAFIQDRSSGEIWQAVALPACF